MKNRKMKKLISRIVFCFLVIIILFFIYENLDIIKNEIYNLYLNRKEEISESESIAVEIKETNENKITIDNSKFNIIFFDVGQADSTLILCDGKVMLIDAGNTYDGKNIVNTLKEIGIEKIDYLVATHPHEDHVGGMSYIIDSFEIDNLFMPYYNKIDFKFYDRLIESAENKNLEIDKKINIGDKYELGKANFEIMSVDNSMPENINDSSIVIEFTYGNLKYLFMADSEELIEKSRDWEDVDLLKVGHHGSNSSSSKEFLEQTLPEISIISVGENNDYELPKKRVLERLNEIGSEIYRTDVDGTIQVISDGIQNEVVKIDISCDGN